MRTSGFSPPTAAKRYHGGMEPRRNAILIGLLGQLAAGSTAAQSTEPRALVVIDEASHVVVLAYRTGLLSFLAHDHAILAGAWHARLCMVPAEPNSARGVVRVRTSALEIDTDRGRALAGLGSDGPDEETRLELQRKLLAPAALDAAGHPWITLALDSVRVGNRVGADGVSEGTGYGSITIRGVERDVVFPLRTRSGAGGVSVLARLRLRQTGYGIRPESVAGVVKVADEVEVRMSLQARTSADPCPPSG